MRKTLSHGGACCTVYRYTLEELTSGSMPQWILANWRRAECQQCPEVVWEVAAALVECRSCPLRCLLKQLWAVKPSEITRVRTGVQSQLSAQGLPRNWLVVVPEVV